MNTAQTAVRILRHASVTDPAALPLSQAREVTGAISAAVAKFFRDGPAVMRRTTAAVALSPPRTVPGYLVEAGALEPAAGPDPFGVSERGASLAIEGDARRNEITGSRTWLAPYLGASGVREMTVYGDAVPVGARMIERIASDPWIDEGNGAGGRPSVSGRLTRIAADGPDIAARWSEAGDRPRYYEIRSAGASRGSAALYVLRVWPPPSRPMILSFAVDVQPDAFDEHALWRVPVELPFSDSQMETVILPLAEEELLRSTLLRELPDRLADLIQAAGADARRTLAKIPKDHGKPRGRLRTRTGW